MQYINFCCFLIASKRLDSGPCNNYKGQSALAQNIYSTRSPTSPFFCPTFFTAAILLASGFGFTSFCVCGDLSCHKAF